MRAGYWRDWRAAHPAYQERERERSRARRARGRDRTAEYARTAARRAARPPPEPLAPLFPELRHGSAVEWWDEALAADLEQERALAELEGRDADAAVAAYRTRELVWARITAPLEVDAADGRHAGVGSARQVAALA